MWNLAGVGGVKTDNTSTMTIELGEPSDTDLVARARSGDSAAFGALVGRYQKAALRLAAAIGGSVDDAADIAQEAFVKAHRSLPKLADPSMVRSWMLRIVANEAKNHLRSRDRRHRRDERYGSWVISAVPDPETSALDSDEARGLGSALGGQGSLYPALHKLEQQGWIEAEWGESENNRRAKYYTITREGRRFLKQEAAQWERLSAAISGIVRLA